jgi:hypothetical protein
MRCFAAFLQHGLCDWIISLAASAPPAPVLELLARFEKPDFCAPAKFKSRTENAVLAIIKESHAAIEAVHLAHAGSRPRSAAIKPSFPPLDLLGFLQVSPAFLTEVLAPAQVGGTLFSVAQAILFHAQALQRTAPQDCDRQLDQILTALVAVCVEGLSVATKPQYVSAPAAAVATAWRGGCGRGCGGISLAFPAFCASPPPVEMESRFLSDWLFDGKFFGP